MEEVSWQTKSTPTDKSIELNESLVGRYVNLTKSLFLSLRSSQNSAPRQQKRYSEGNRSMLFTNQTSSSSPPLQFSTGENAMSLGPHLSLQVHKKLNPKAQVWRWRRSRWFFSNTGENTAGWTRVEAPRWSPNCIYTVTAGPRIQPDWEPSHEKRKPPQ